MMSRTNLKQQLMREQMQEQDRKEAEQRHISRSAPHSSAISVPSSLSVVKLPEQIFQVQSRLENPTRYHVVQSQKRQVHQFLSDAHGSRSLQESGVGSSPQIALSPAQILNTRDPMPNSPLSAAPSSSAATSPSEVDDFWEDISQLETGIEIDGLEIEYNHCNTVPGNTNIIELFSSMPSSNKVSASCPAEVTRIKEEPLSFPEIDIQALAKDRQKKNNHNMIERRRRYNINDRIKELGSLLPKNNDPYADVIRDGRQNKGTILKASVDYLRHLKSEVEKIPELEEKHRQLELQNKKLNFRIQELQSLLYQHSQLERNWTVENNSEPMAHQQFPLQMMEGEITNQTIKIESEASPSSFITHTEDMTIEDDDLFNIADDPLLAWQKPRDVFLSEKMDNLS